MAQHEVDVTPQRWSCLWGDHILAEDPAEWRELLILFNILQLTNIDTQSFINSFRGSQGVLASLTCAHKCFLWCLRPLDDVYRCHKEKSESYECLLLKPARKNVSRDQSGNDFSKKQVLQDSEVSLSSIGVSTPTWSIVLPCNAMASMRFLCCPQSYVDRYFVYPYDIRIQCNIFLLFQYISVFLCVFYISIIFSS